MAHTIVAADLGGSHIKLARFEASFRKLVLLETRIVAAPVAGPPEERVPRQLAAMQQYLASEKLETEELIIGLPGDALSFRVLDLPFSNPKQIESVLGYELESQILTPVEELVIDFVVVGPARGGGAAAGETRVLVAAAPRALVEAVVKAATELQLPLRTIGAAPLAYGSLLAEERAASQRITPVAVTGEGAAAEEVVAAPAPRDEDDRIAMVVDIGAERTTVCVLRGERPLMARTIARGGRQLTEAIGAAFHLDKAAAEKAKHEAAFLAHKGMARLSPSQAHMDQAVRRALSPLVRELRQTLASFRATYSEGPGVTQIFLAGAGSRIEWLDSFLAEELGIECGPLPFREREGWSSVRQDRLDTLAVALGMGLDALHPDAQVNFRKGEFAYRSDFSFLRAKALHLAVAAGLIVMFAGLNTWASYRGLHREHEMLAARLKKSTIEVFGKERDDLSRISEELKEGPKASAQIPIPASTAFDILEEISRTVPPSDKIRLDIEDIEIAPKKTSLKGTTETAQQVDDLTDALRKVDCFEDVQKGRLTKRALPPPPAPAPGEPDSKDKKPGPTELTQFTLTIKASCP